MAFGLRVSPSSVLKNLLTSYPSGGQFISEALQNAEDTNRSSKFCAILDLQQHPARNVREDHRPWRDRLQGPAFLFYDDGGFADRDWESLQRIYDSEKRHSPSEVGKYGMGSRSFFHIGDVIQIVSGTKFAVLDPDERVSRKGDFGACVDFVHDRFDGKTFFARYPDECAPFRGIFGCTMTSAFKGTIIRVPLRLAAFARESTFMPKAFPVERAKKVFQDFEQELAGGRVALFLPRLESIQLRLREHGGRLELKASVSIARTKRQQRGLLDVKAYLQKFQTTENLQAALADNICSAPMVHEEVRLKLESLKGGHKETSWVRIGRFFDCTEDLEALPEEVPFVCLAMPKGGPCEGLAFAHLPLPLKTGLPVHLHAGFALQANRRGLWRNSAGLKLDGEHATWAAWNEHILQVVAPEVYAEALKLLQADLGPDKWFDLWPSPEMKQNDFEVVVTGLVDLLRGEPILQTALGAWVTPQDAQLLDLPTDALKTCHGEMHALCVKAGMKIVNLPDHVAQLLQDHNAIGTKDTFSAIKEAVIERECNHGQRLRILLALMEWAHGSFNQRKMTALANSLRHTRWIPVADGLRVAISEAFDPEHQLPQLNVVRRCAPKLASQLEKQFATPEAIAAIWQALRNCGLKQQITWEDAVEEARHIERTSNQKLSKMLFQHLENSHWTMSGSKQCLQSLKQLKWVAVHPPQRGTNVKPQETRGSTLSSLSDAFPAAEFDWVWAVEHVLHADLPSPNLLRAVRSVKTEPEVLVAQLETCAKAVPEHSDSSQKLRWFGGSQSVRVREAGPEAFCHIKVVLDVLERDHKNSAKQLVERLSSLAYLPCQGAKSGLRALLFRPDDAALLPNQGFQNLLPAFGTVHPHAFEFATSIGVPCRPHVSALVEAIPHFDLDLAVSLCAELAEQADAENFEKHLRGLKLPTNSHQFQPRSKVYINDASWKGADGLQTLDDRISHHHGRKLGCKSVREKMKQECEAFADEDDAFGQEADLVDQVKLILRDYSSKSDVVAEFVQNTDDFGATELTFELNGQTFRKDRVVDSRCEALQGPALYILSNKELRDEDIKHMQRVGRSAKCLEFTSIGRFGVGMNVMYRYSDCPQLFANGRLHFFDLGRNFVAKSGEKRGKRFNKEKLEEMFPDSMEPFRTYLDKYPVVFRLPLRTESSELGEKVTLSSVEKVLRDVSRDAFSMLLFAKWLKTIRFKTPSGTMAEHSASIDDAVQARKHRAFFASLPTGINQVRSGMDKEVCVTKRMTSREFIARNCPPKTSERMWVVAYTLALSQGNLRQLCMEYFTSALGGALLPLAAAAAPLDHDKSEGRICCGLPTPLHSGSRSWISAQFVLQSSRKQLLLPEGKNQEQERQWNLQLLQYPAALSLKTVMMECRAVVTSRGHLETFFDLLPSGEAPLETELAVATFYAALEEEIFPVLSSSNAEDLTVHWVAGPWPLLQTLCLSEQVQEALAFDGLQVVSLSTRALKVYGKALEVLQLEDHEGPAQPRELTATELCTFLAEQWAALHPMVGQNVTLEEAGMVALCDGKSVLKMLKFSLPPSTPSEQHLCEHLEGVPLLLTQSNELCAFGRGTIRFCTDRDLLPNHPGLFIHDDACKLFKAAPGMLEPIGVRGLHLNDLVPYKGEIEAMAFSNPAFDESSYLQHLWHFMAMRSEEDPFQVMKSWRILPVRCHPSGAQVVRLDLASQTVAIASEGQRVSKKTLLHAGLMLLQAGVFNTSKPFLLSNVVRTDKQVIRLLVSRRQALTHLSEEDRHTLLAYFSLLVISDPQQLLVDDIHKLPLFKLANGQGFTDLCQTNVAYCCLHPNDTHAHALEQLMPSNSVLLSFPTEPAKPIYDFLKIQQCNGEDFMVRFIIPQLPKVCREGSSRAKPYLDELYQFVVAERSQKVMEAAKEMAFIPSQAGELKTASSLVDPRITVAQLFANCLTEALPVSWVEELEYLELLLALGLKEFIPAPLLLKCAQDLHLAKDQHITTNLREKSSHLVEAVAQKLANAFARRNVGESSSLVRAAELHILVTASLASNDLPQEIESNMVSNGPRAWDKGTLKLRPFRGAAFGEAISLLWTTCPVAVHLTAKSQKFGKQTEHLSYLIKHYAEDMHSALGAHVSAGNVPFPLLTQHMFNLCSKPYPDREELQLTSGSLFHKEWEACQQESSNRLNLSELSDPKPLKAFYCEHARCVRIQQSDAADKPAETQIVLASPRRCFFFSQDGCKASDFHGLLRKAQARFENLYTSMGVQEVPDVHDLAAVTKRVKQRIQFNDGVTFEEDLKVLEACMKGFHACVQNLAEEALESLETVEFFLPQKAPDGKVSMEEAYKLVWMDMDRWKSRLGDAELQCRLWEFPGEMKLNDDMMESLSWAGLQPVSHLVEEAANSDLVASDPLPGSIQEAIGKLLSSPLMLPALEAILQQNNKDDETIDPVLHELLEAQLLLDVKSVPNNIRTSLHWKDGGVKLEGSETVTLAFLQSDKFLVSDDAFNLPDQFVSDLLAAFCHIPGFLWYLKLPKVEKAVKELLKLAFSKGPGSIPDVLRDNEIQSGLETTSCLGIGDRFPDELLDKLNYSMAVVFEEGEYVIAAVDGKHLVAQVAPWDNNFDEKQVKPAGHGLMRRYRVVVSTKGRQPDRILILSHTELYKTCGRDSQISLPAAEGCLVAAGAVSDSGCGVSQDERACMEEVKGHLRQMAKMNQADYKKALHRLFLRWHPDKSGNTPFNNQIFRMLKAHETWYRQGGGSDAWLDDFNVEASKTHQSEEDWDTAEATQASRKRARHYESQGSSQASWFHEFQEEWQRQQSSQSSRHVRKNSPAVRIFFCPQPQQFAAPRTVDESQASAFLAQAEYDLQVMLHLKDASDSTGAPFSSATVFQASQAVEKALKAAMLRTCGLAKEEFTGREAHDLPAFHQNLKEASPETYPQRQAQEELPGTASDMSWLRHAYLASRYPNASHGRIPALEYQAADAERASRLAQQTVQWAKRLEDLPQPNKRRRSN